MTHEEMEGLLPELGRLSDPDLGRKVVQTWLLAVERGTWKRIDDVPFTLLVPDSRISLIKHTRTVTQMAISVAEVLGGVNLDYLIAGGLTHDVGKLLEYTRAGGRIVKSDMGRLVRHPVSGYALAVEAGLPTEVCHIIAAHSAEGDRVARSPEAIIINHCDFIQFDIVKGSK